jgi:hypothetical protein
MAGRPLIIAGAGPSLGAAVRILKNWPAEGTEARGLGQQGGPSVQQGAPDRPVILATGRAFPVFYRAGIVPQMVALLDDQEDVQDFFRGLDLSRTLLIANTTANAAACRMFSARVFYRAARENMGPGYEYPGERILWKGTATLQETTGYIGHEAAFIGQILGADPLIFVGYDCQGAAGMKTLLRFLTRWALSNRGRNIWNASPGSAWTKGVRPVAPRDLPRLLSKPIPAPGGPNP